MVKFTIKHTVKICVSKYKHNSRVEQRLLTDGPALPCGPASPARPVRPCVMELWQACKISIKPVYTVYSADRCPDLPLHQADPVLQAGPDLRRLPWVRTLPQLPARPEHPAAQRQKLSSCWIHQLKHAFHSHVITNNLVCSVVKCSRDWRTQSWLKNNIRHDDKSHLHTLNLVIAVKLLYFNSLMSIIRNDLQTAFPSLIC